MYNNFDDGCFDGNGIAKHLYLLYYKIHCIKICNCLENLNMRQNSVYNIKNYK